ncbi:lipoate-protein ligase [Trypanosoma rangeli]|uniref:Lipoate-protein ligase n=1 Tax=Trypanosoma rangeli TaxID=5698 RepID=A0A3R7MGW3_TRYRA|nr:lipoate-protein ligase [Trypanosoma rangeli]RNF02299.1 lipoate-protein ligase [Trypanosoma rangeli]|eukprot:RNF02299.1 lipoate-protein ligase [Trypanosoma rangeli]
MRHVKCCLFPATTLSAFIARHAAAAHPERQLTSNRASVGLVSDSRCIFENLAVEEALLRGVVLPPGQQLLFSYVNRPCVVVGRNQNYLQEVAVSAARRDGVTVARRSSGGGTVYHDTGNVCISFFTHRDAYHPERTIQVVRLFLCCVFGIRPERLTTTCRHDLFLDGKKITGSAMRVQRDIACHHCTLLVASCRERISTYLRPEGRYVSFTTSSIGSVSSPVTTLQLSGVMPEVRCSGDHHNNNDTDNTDDMVHSTQRALLDFFFRHGAEIISHSAPWEMEPSVFLYPKSKETKKHGPKALLAPIEGVFMLDLASTPQEDTPIVDGEGRMPVAGASKTLREEVDRLRSADWMFSMPKFTTCVAVTVTDLLKYQQDVRADARIPAEVILYLMQSHTQFEITTVVEKRRITALTVCWGEKTAGDMGEAWCANMLRVLLEGANVDDVALNVSEGNAMLVAGLEFECLDLMNGVPLPPVEAASAGDVRGNSSLDGQSALLLFLQTVLCVWRAKNVFVPVCA